MSELSKGVLPASVTPFLSDGQIDLPSVARLLARFRDHGCAGVVFAGTNGEGPSLSAVEKRDLVRAAVPLAAGMPVVLGVATASLTEAIWSCESARKAGAAAALVMAPAYFREAPEAGIEQWFLKLLAETSLPVIVYNFPQRTGFTFSPELIERLCSHPGVAGLKDSSGEEQNLVPYAQAVKGKRLYVGSERLLLQALEAGWSGSISGAANVLSRWLVPIAAEWEIDRESSKTKLEYLLPGMQALKTAPQPAANKWVLQRLGIIESAMPREPLLPMDGQIGEALWEKLRGIVSPT